MTSDTNLRTMIKDLQRRIKLIRIGLKNTSSFQKKQELNQLLLCIKNQITNLMDQMLHLKAIDCNEATHHHRFL